MFGTSAWCSLFSYCLEALFKVTAKTLSLPYHVLLPSQKKNNPLSVHLIIFSLLNDIDLASTVTLPYGSFCNTLSPLGSYGLYRKKAHTRIQNAVNNL